MKNAIFLISVVLFACNTTPEASTDKIGGKDAISESGTCYTFSKDSSVIWMNITIADNIVSGELVYDLHEKDRNAGTIEGEMQGDTLFASYNFISEGVKSSREVAFLKLGNSWKHGYAEMQEKNGQLIFKDKSKIKFGDTVVLKEGECD